jgi:ornithine cyclodeaminase
LLLLRAAQEGHAPARQRHVRGRAELPWPTELADRLLASAPEGRIALHERDRAAVLAREEAGGGRAHHAGTDVTTLRAMTGVYAAADVHAALPLAALAEALRRAFLRGAQVPLRHAHALSAADTLLLMPAWDEDLVVTKLVTVMPGAPHTVQASLVALDRATGEVRALLDGEALTLRRTAAASALAAQHLARADARTLPVVGSGRLGAWMARAHVALRPGLTRAPPLGPARRKRPRSACRNCARPCAPSAAQPPRPWRWRPSLEAAGARGRRRRAAPPTLHRAALVRGAWLRPGAHLDAVRRLPARACARPTTRPCAAPTWVVDTFAGALAEAGDLTKPQLARGLIDRAHVRAELAGLLADPWRLGRTDAQAVTLCKSVAQRALEDLAAAQCAPARG